MIVRGWAGTVAVAIGAAACAGAAQLGLGYGLGIISWQPSTSPATEAAWVANLTWTAWAAANAAVAGAIYAGRFGRADRLGRAPAGGSAGTPTAGNSRATPADRSGDGPVTNAMWRVALAIAAAVGAVVTVLLVMVPAQSATRGDTFSPEIIAGGCAVGGIVLGLLVGVWAQASPAVATNVTVTAAWMWLLAAAAVVHGTLTGNPATTSQLGVYQLTPDSERYWFGAVYWPGAALTLGAALVIGALAAIPAARRGDRRVGVAVSGALGPVLVAAAYFLAAPRLVGIRGDQASAYLLAPYAVSAGLAGSVLVAAICQRARRIARESAARSAEEVPEVGSAPAPVAASVGPPSQRTARPAESASSGGRSRSGATTAFGAARASAPAPSSGPPPSAATNTGATNTGATNTAGAARAGGGATAGGATGSSAVNSSPAEARPSTAARGQAAVDPAPAQPVPNPAGADAGKPRRPGRRPAAS